jgi:hypothetical protein
VIFILTALLIVGLLTTAVIAKSPNNKRNALIGLLLVLILLGGLPVLAYVHVAYYAGQVFWPPPLLWLPFVLLCCGTVAVISYLRKLKRVH